MNVSAHEKKQVPKGFDRVAKSYDFLTALNPGYLKHLRLSAKRLQLRPRARILDLCSGTGLSTAALRAQYPQAEITGMDFSAGMIEQARSKSKLGDVHWIHGDATDPAGAGVEGTFDAIYMAYGIRNLPDPAACLQNLYALLKPKGKLCIHEYSVADSRRSRWIWNAVTLGVVIPSGLVFAKSSEIFRYLRRSVLDFDGVRDFEMRLEHHGYEVLPTRTMSGWQKGIVHTFLAQRGD